MSHTEEQLRHIASEAALKFYSPERIGAITGVEGTSWVGDPSYVIELQIEQDDDREHAARTRTRLSQAIRDRLLEAGDETYPYVYVKNWRAESIVG